MTAVDTKSQFQGSHHPTPQKPASFTTPGVRSPQNVTALLEEAAIMLMDAAGVALRQAQANAKRAQEDADAIRQLSRDIQKVIGGETCS